METETCAEASGKKSRKRQKRICGQIKQQMEFYFGDANLLKDRFLKKLMDESPDKYVDLEVFLSFNKMKPLADGIGIIAKALSSSSMLKVSDCGRKVTRVTPVGNQSDVDDRTIYVEGLPELVDHDWLKRTFSCYGPVSYVSLPRYRTTRDLKGFGFVEFETVEAARKAAEKLSSDNSADKIGKFPKAGNKDIQRLSRRARELNQGEMEVDDDAKCDAQGNVKEMHDAGESGTNKIKPRRDASEVEKSAPATADDTTSTKAKERSPRKRKRSEGEGASKTDKRAKLDGKIVERLSAPKPEKSTPRKRKHARVESESDGDDAAATKVHRVTPAVVDGVSTKNEQSAEKKKRKKKKKKKEKASTDKMRVISKRDWLLLRSEYLVSQKSRMSLLKKSLNAGQKSQNDGCNGKQKATNAPSKVGDDVVAPVPRFVYQPGVIVHVKSTDPLHRKSLKEQLPADGLAYIELREGDLSGFVRCTSETAAKSVLATDVKGLNFALLSGDEEKSYWEKMMADCETKRGQNHRGKKKRGVQKIMDKVERVTMETGMTTSHKHVYFGD